MKLALILNVVDPLVGGVLIMGHRGTAKSTAVRGLTDLLPPIRVVSDCAYQCDPKDEKNLCDSCQSALDANARLTSEVRPVSVVELPLGATEDRVCGTINLERALNEGATVLAPGLLARANRGFLYIDEVNLLEDHLVDVLLDVAASGVNRIEREGVSVEHPSRFVLIGSGNPEEGELRPQLLDRFGLYVQISTEADPERRAQVVELREAYNRDPAAFSLTFADEQDQLVSRIVRAQRNLVKTKIDRPLLMQAAELCAELAIEGHRGELTLVRAARANAALHGRTKVTGDDLRRVAKMSLCHRLPRNAFEDGAAADRIEEALDRLESTAANAVPNRSDRKTADSQEPTAGQSLRSKNSENGNSGDSEFPAPPAKAVKKMRVNLTKNQMSSVVEENSRGSGKKRRRINQEGGRYVRSVSFQTTAKRIALAATIRALVINAGAARMRKTSVSLAEPGPYNSIAESLRYKLFSRKHGALFVFVIDASGSMARHRIGLAKRAILDLLRQSYLDRDMVAIVTFRGTTASVSLPPSRSILRARNSVDSLNVGGGTPLSAALLRALEIIRRDTQPQKWLIVFTDGRANVSLRSAASSASRNRDERIADEVKQLGALLRKLGTNIIVANTQREFEKSDDAKQVARWLNAQHFRVCETADAVQ
jgi:magnesium chelatase subunit D